MGLGIVWGDDDYGMMHGSSIEGEHVASYGGRRFGYDDVRCLLYELVYPCSINDVVSMMSFSPVLLAAC
jgi:hypothetical protein